MPLTIPTGTKFEAIKPTTNVNRRSALVNANDLTYTIDDIAATVGGNVTFPITNNYIPKADNAGGIVDSSLYESVGFYGNSLNGNYDGGLYLYYQSSVPLLNIFGSSVNTSSVDIGDVYSSAGPAWGISLASSVLNPSLNIYTNGVNVLSFFSNSGQYEFGGVTSRFGITNGDLPQASLFVTNDLVVDVLGTKYIKVLFNGAVYKIELVP
jgi:hypothetical protein